MVALIHGFWATGTPDPLRPSTDRKRPSCERSVILGSARLSWIAAADSCVCIAMRQSDPVPVKRVGVLSDDDGFAAFYGACRTEVARALILAIGDRDLGSEAADEAFARALERWSDVKDYENPEGWVFRVGLNWAKSRLRRRSVPTALLDDGHHVDELPEPELLEAVEQLPFGYRSVVVARFFLDWSIQQTAEALDLPEGTVKSRQVRALKRLHKKLGGSK